MRNNKNIQRTVYSLHVDDGVLYSWVEHTKRNVYGISYDTTQYTQDGQANTR